MRSWFTAAILSKQLVLLRGKCRIFYKLLKIDLASTTRGTASASPRSRYQLWVILQVIIKLKKRVGWIFSETMRLAKIFGNLLHSISTHSLLSNVACIAGSVDTHRIMSSGNRTILSRMGAIWLGHGGRVPPLFQTGGHNMAWPPTFSL